MSIIKSIKQVLGLHNTASENHFWDGSTANQLSLKRGTPDAPGAEVMKVNAGVVSFPNQLQTWQNMLGSRALGNTYTNSTGQTIFVAVTATSSATQGYVFANVGGRTIQGSLVYAAGNGSSVVFPVPDGASYVVNIGSPTSVMIWEELR